MKIPFERYFVSQRTKPIIGVDIGSSSIKFAEIALVDNKAELINVGTIPTPENAVVGSNISKPDLIANALVTLFDSHKVETRRVAFSIPSASVFTKRISLSKAAAANLASNILFEAGNYIPHRMDAVHVDYQVIDASGANTEVLLVAVKKDLLHPYQKIFTDIGFEAVIADVETFAVCNVFDRVVDPDKKILPTVIIDIGFRHTTVSVMHKGSYVLSGEVNIGIKNYVTSLIENLSVTPDQAVSLLSGIKMQDVDEVLYNENIDRVTDYVATELHRQTGFFWNGAGTNQSIAQVFLSGGGARISSLVTDLKSRFGVPCEFLLVGNAIEVSPSIDVGYVKELNLPLNVALGLALRRSSDKEVY